VLRLTTLGDQAHSDGWNRVEIRCYPHSDTSFVTAVNAVLDEWAEGELQIDAISARLAPKYPRVKVVKQDSLASLGKRPVVYAYRDGHP
jgi:hypothetical protein